MSGRSLPPVDAREPAPAPPVAAPEPVSGKRDAGGTLAPKRDRRGRRYAVARLRYSGLPRVLERQDGAPGIAARRYMLALLDRLGLPVPPPVWSEPYLIDATRAAVVLGQLHRALDLEMAKPEPHPAEARRLRSEIRRTSSQRARAESVLGKLADEVRKREAAQPLSIAALLGKVGTR